MRTNLISALQFLLITVSLGGPVLGYTGHPALHYLWAATGTTTFLSAVSYAFMKVATFCRFFHLGGEKYKPNTINYFPTPLFSFFQIARLRN